MPSPTLADRGTTPPIDVAALIDAVQTNCDISDAHHAGDYTLCTYLLKMREFYRWEHDIPFFTSVPQDDLGSWLTARERRWDELETEPLARIPLAAGGADPFHSDAINRELVPQGYVYSGGYGRWQKPLFFLGRLLQRYERDGFTVLVSDCEYARELAAPPAMLQGDTIYVRAESARRFVWEKIDETQWHRQDSAMQRALDDYGFSATDAAATLERMTADAIDIMVAHELGEGRAGRLLGDEWAAMLAGLQRSRAEAVARAVRDHLADCLSTVPMLVARAEAPALHFYFANVDGVRKELFPEMHAAYRQWLADRDFGAIGTAVAASTERWLATATGFVAAFKHDPASAAALMERCLEGPAFCIKPA